MPLSINEGKATFYSYLQSNLTNTQHLDKFNNLVDISNSYDFNPHDKSIPNYDVHKICSKKSNEVKQEHPNEYEEDSK